MAKQLHPTTERVYAVIAKHFKKGEVLPYAFIGDKLGINAETAREHSRRLAAKRIVSIKGGHIVGVK